MNPSRKKGRADAAATRRATLLGNLAAMRSWLEAGNADGDAKALEIAEEAILPQARELARLTAAGLGG
jgi:hypothetical protein